LWVDLVLDLDLDLFFDACVVTILVVVLHRGA
jgi:hypothetical protein